jgi:hypothetical protein
LEELEQTAKKYVGVSNTRWLSFYNAVKSVVENWEVLVAMLKQDTSAAGKALLASVTQYSFVACATYLADVLFSLNSLCLIFQREHLNMEVVISQTKTTVEALHDLVNSNHGPHFADFVAAVPEQVEESHAGTGMGYFMYKNHAVAGHATMSAETQSAIQTYMKHLFDNLQDRLFDMGRHH